MQGRGEALAQGTHDAVAARTQLDLALQPLQEARRWEVEAAYAFARRRDQDSTWRTAADLIEVALGERRRSAYGPPRWWQRVEAGLAAYVAIAAVQVSAVVFAGQWYRLPIALLYLLLPVLHIQTLRRNNNDIPAVAGAPGTIPQRAAAVRNAVSKMSAAECDPVVVDRLCAVALGESGRGEVDRRLGALAVASAQRLVAVEMGRGRRRALELLDAARRRLLAVESIGQQGGPTRAR